MERILIIGCSGSGKTTLSRKLGEKLNIPVVHLDRIWWTGNWENITREEFDARLEEEMAKPKWIMDGNYSRTIPQRLQRCDTIIYLDFDRWTCLWGMFKRVITNLGRTRPDMGGNCRERFDWQFIKWIWNFNKTNRVRNYTWLAQAKHAKSIVLKSRSEVKEFLAKL